MNLQILQGLMIPFLGTSLGAACVFFMRGKLNPMVQRALTGFAAGVMVAASVWSLLLPAIEQSAAMGRWAFVPAVVGFWIGVLFLLLLDRTIPHLHAGTGEAEGPLFRGTIAPFAVDTQKVPKGGKPFLSARYLLCGKDRDGNGCRVFIENQGVFGEEFTPLVVTDSPLLADWETAPLSATVEGAPGGVTVRLFRGA